MRKIELMHHLYGKSAGRCKDCSNFVRGRYHNKMLQKCQIYGLTHSEASDWAQRWTACGRFNQPMGDYERPVIKRKIGKTLPDMPLDGQTGLEVTP